MIGEDRAIVRQALRMAGYGDAQADARIEALIQEESVPTLPHVLDLDRLNKALRLLHWWPDEAIDEVARGISFAYSTLQESEAPRG